MPTIHDDRNVSRNTDLHRRTESGAVRHHRRRVALAALAVVSSACSFMLSDRNPISGHQRESPGSDDHHRSARSGP